MAKKPNYKLEPIAGSLIRSELFATIAQLPDQQRSSVAESRKSAFEACLFRPDLDDGEDLGRWEANVSGAILWLCQRFGKKTPEQSYEDEPTDSDLFSALIKTGMQVSEHRISAEKAVEAERHNQMRHALEDAYLSLEKAWAIETSADRNKHSRSPFPESKTRRAIRDAQACISNAKRTIPEGRKLRRGQQTPGREQHIAKFSALVQTLDGPDGKLTGSDCVVFEIAFGFRQPINDQSNRAKGRDVGESERIALENALQMLKVRRAFESVESSPDRPGDVKEPVRPSATKLSPAELAMARAEFERRVDEWKKKLKTLKPKRGK
jgi:hypothetical protein